MSNNMLGSPQAKRFTLLALVLALPLGGCGESGEPDTASKEEESSDVTTVSTSTEGIAVGGVFAQAEFAPVGGSDVRGTATFREVGDLGVQVELDTSGWQKPGTSYYAQIHEGDCTSVEAEGDAADTNHVHEPEPSGASYDHEHANGAHDHEDGEEDHHHDEASIADELPGDIDQPVEGLSSYDGTASVTSLLEGVTSEQILSGEPKYFDLHATDPEYAAPLACASLSETS